MKLSRTLIPDLAALQAFEAAARHVSFTRAAEELNLTQSAVSRQIKDLETQLGIGLFTRVRQRILLSDAGRRLLPEVEQLLAGMERLAMKAAGSRDASGHLTIATLPTFGSRWLMPRLPDFLARHDGVQATVVSRASPFAMAAEGVDIAIHYGLPDWPAAQCTYLCGEAVVPVAAPRMGRPDVFSGSVPLLQIESRPMLWAEWLEANGHQGMDAFAGHRFDTFALLIDAAVSGLGIALVPRYLVERELAEGMLVLLSDAVVTTNAAYYVVLPDELASDPMCLAFRDWICGQVQRKGT
ncbi:LysR family transcriptional regulator (plasmid) [Paracoccus sp. Arc7-R13]|uniref:LysR substrate-binding domain-containing protein n=1 Tax=Paracoccus sp. Arc7-R13 TaxID=2500532 RepID=UPI000FDC9664|nr:LysR substrate-binding domain-containing protein [Paracoccus sp. Arc7-R13]AZY96040.1 LysR family transcriptional regulator [Paracoccus sp. Arc7-R13]